MVENSKEGGVKMDKIRDGIMNPDLTWKGDVSKYVRDPSLYLTLEKSKFDYNKFLSLVQCSNGLSSIPDVSDMQKFKDKDEVGFLDFIREDCLARLADARDTNSNAKSVSAFMSIPAFIGFLSKLAFYENTEFLNRVNSGARDVHRGIDGKAYLEFVNRFMLGETEAAQLQRKDGIGFVLYKMVRCGLLHGGTLTNEQITDVRISITHQGGHSVTQIDSLLKKRSGLISIVIDAGELCNSIESAIWNVFETNDDDILNSIKDVYVKEPPIIVLKAEEES